MALKPGQKEQQLQQENLISVNMIIKYNIIKTSEINTKNR